MKLGHLNISMRIISSLVVAEICILFANVVFFKEVVFVFIADSSVPAIAMRHFVRHCSLLAHLKHVLPLGLDVAEHVVAIGGHGALMTALRLVIVGAVVTDLIVEIASTVVGERVATRLWGLEG